jgi:two-component system cell cycle response regulator DivK
MAEIEARTVLIVEDNRQNLELVQFLLEEAGLRVRCAVDARQAREELDRELPDLVLMDMQLPGVDGLELVADLRRDGRFLRLPIVALTAHALRGDRERFLAGGCDGYIAKPIDVGTFAGQVEGLLRASSGGEGTRAGDGVS